MIPSRKSVPTRYFSPLLGMLAAQGVDTAGLLALAKIDAGRMERSDGMLSPPEVEALVIATNRLTGRTDLAFETARSIKLNSHDMLGYALLSCRDLDQMLRLASRYYHLINELFAMQYTRKAGAGQVVFTPVVAMPVQAMRFVMELIAVSVHNQLEMVLGAGVPYEACMGMPAPAHHARYTTLIPARFRFDDSALPGIAMAFDAALLDRPLPMAEPKVVEQIEERLQSLQRRPVPDRGWGDYVVMLLREAQGQQVTLEDIAQRMNISARTVDRNLKKEHLNFRDLSQQVRLERARELLLQRGATVSRVAEQLGFSDAANFSRAFRRQMGVSPGAFQQQALSARNA
ncbi:AraC family transcriptional regulator ligand-binding domain-containing protein [Variovorax robiniae]|uniref:AraC family transcriptional regulator ligand-binding domain-containing protein n=1 Tax=Variovorax robiniae TaxID=1836199 RepID=A0ABU8X558_9BURK